MKRLVRPNLQILCAADTFKDPNKAEWGMGFEDFERITYADETDLNLKIQLLLSDWKAGHKRHRVLAYKDKFPEVHRFAVKSCGTKDGNMTIVIGVSLSGWDAWKQSVALMLGR